MIDLHCHLLPGLDDGSPDLATSLALAEHAVACGITHSVCTPHIHHGRYNNNLSDIRQACENLSRHLREQQCPLHITYAAEVRICAQIVTMKNNNTLPYIGRWQGRPVLLLELPHSHIPAGTEQLIGWLLKAKIQPLIAHPERNRDVWRDYKRAQQLVKLGCLLQVTAGAFTGCFNPPSQQIARQLLQDDLISIIASDAHNLDRRPPDMRAAYQQVSQLQGEQTAQRLFKTTPWDIASCLFSELVTDINLGNTLAIRTAF